MYGCQALFHDASPPLSILIPFVLSVATLSKQSGRTWQTHSHSPFPPSPAYPASSPTTTRAPPLYTHPLNADGTNARGNSGILRQVPDDRGTAQNNSMKLPNCNAGIISDRRISIPPLRLRRTVSSVYRKVVLWRARNAKRDGEKGIGFKTIWDHFVELPGVIRSFLPLHPHGAQFIGEKKTFNIITRRARARALIYFHRLLS